MTDDFMDDDYGTNVSGQRPWSVAWLKDLIEYHIPELSEADKKGIIGMFKPLLDNAAKTNLDDLQIRNMLRQYDIIWDKYFLYMKRGKKDPRLLVLKESLFAGYEQQLNRSKKFGQMRLVMEQHSIIKTINQGFDKMGSRLGFFKSKNKETNQDESVMQ